MTNKIGVMLQGFLQEFKGEPHCFPGSSWRQLDVRTGHFMHQSAESHDGQRKLWDVTAPPVPFE